MFEKVVLYLVAFFGISLGLWMMFFKKRKQIKIGSAILVAGMALVGVEKLVNVSLILDKSIKQVNEQQFAITNIIRNVVEVRKEVVEMKEVIDNFFKKACVEIIYGTDIRGFALTTNAMDTTVAILLTKVPVHKSVTVYLRNELGEERTMRYGDLHTSFNSIMFTTVLNVDPRKLTYIVTYTEDTAVSNLYSQAGSKISNLFNTIGCNKDQTSIWVGYDDKLPKIERWSNMD